MSYWGEYFTGCLAFILGQIVTTLHQGDIVDNVSYTLDWSKMEANYTHQFTIYTPYIKVCNIP